jgi:hypothetical protein
LRKKFQAHFQDTEEYYSNIWLIQNPFTFETEKAPGICPHSDSKFPTINGLAGKCWLFLEALTYVSKQFKNEICYIKILPRITEDHLHYCSHICHQLSNILQSSH